MSRKYLLTALPAGLLLAGAAFAQDTGTPSAVAPAPGVPPAGTTGQDAPLQSLDTDRDGSISMQEAARNPGLSAQFLTLDKNGNGALEPAEFARFEAAGTAPSPGMGTGTAPSPGTGAGVAPATGTTPGTPPRPVAPSGSTNGTSTQPPMTNQSPPSGSTPPPR
jgi:hypothetical protein